MNNNNFILYISPFTSNLTYYFRIASHIAKFSERKIVRLFVYLIPSLLARKEGPITRLSRSSCFERIRSTGGLGRWWNSLECTYIYIFFFPLVSADSVQLCNFHRNQRRARRKRSLLVCKTLVEKGRCTSGSDQASTIDFRPSQNFPSFSFFLPLAFFLFRLPVRISAPNRSPYFNGSGYIMCSTRVPFP